MSRTSQGDLDVAETLGEVSIQGGQLVQGAVGGALLVAQHLRQEERSEWHVHHNALHTVGGTKY